MTVDTFSPNNFIKLVMLFEVQLSHLYTNIPTIQIVFVLFGCQLRFHHEFQFTSMIQTA